MWPGPRPTSMPSFNLIHSTDWPQYTNVTHRQDRQTDNGPIAKGEPFYKRSPKNHLNSFDVLMSKVSRHLLLTGKRCSTCSGQNLSVIVQSVNVQSCIVQSCNLISALSTRSAVTTAPKGGTRHSCHQHQISAGTIHRAKVT